MVSFTLPCRPPLACDALSLEPGLSLLTIDEDDARPLLLMKGGPYQGRNSLEHLKEGADWVEARIFSAIRRAGLDPDEQRSLVHFMPRPTTRSGGLLGIVLDDGTPKS